MARNSRTATPQNTGPEASSATGAGNPAPDLRSTAIGNDTSPTRSDGARVDWIFGSDGILVTEYDVPVSDASDHYPVTADFELS